MKIALAQMNPIIGAFDHNVEKLVTHIRLARKAQCELIIFPELTLCGYPPQDLLERRAFLDAHDQALEKILPEVQDITCILGAPERRQGKGLPLYNSALVITNGKICFRARKQLLPTYDVFDESRYFEPGTGSTVFPLNGLRYGLTVCEDIWSDAMDYDLDPVAEMMSAPSPPDILINISASPYYHGKIGERKGVFADLCQKFHLPLIYVNQVGGQDSLVFDGHSMLVGSEGTVTYQGKGFTEELLFLEIDPEKDFACKPFTPCESESSSAQPIFQDADDDIAQVCDALVLGVHDYLHKTGFKKAVLGLSGGIDSAVTAVLACMALGPDNVTCVAMPSPYTSEASVEDARQLAENLGCRFELLPIVDTMEAYTARLDRLFSDQEEDVTEQNIQARIRGNLLMALSNKFHAMLLSTGNKSEMAVGYCTLYGDMSGGLAVLADVPKVLVYALAEFFNREKEVVPTYIITRPPTAELKPDQCDQDDLPAYEILDPILELYLEEQKSLSEIVAQGYDEQVVRDIIRRVTLNEHKRKQAPLGLKITCKAFGTGRRYPIVHHFRG